MRRISTHARVQRIQCMGVRLRRWARPPKLEEGTATVGTAYWRTPRHLRIGLERIRRHSDSDVLRRVFVVDNASGDGEVARHEDDVVRRLEMPINVGHGVALDWAALNTRTEFFIALDSDAWPVSDDWLEVLLKPLREGAAVSGIAHHDRGYVHPSCLAIRTATLWKHRLSFEHRHPPEPIDARDPRYGPRWWDVGERISWVLRGHGGTLATLSSDPDPSSGTYVGNTYGGIVYHQWYGTRLEEDPDRQDFDGIPRKVIESEMRRWLGDVGNES